MSGMLVCVLVGCPWKCGRQAFVSPHVCHSSTPEVTCLCDDMWSSACDLKLFWFPLLGCHATFGSSVRLLDVASVRHTIDAVVLFERILCRQYCSVVPSLFGMKATSQLRVSCAIQFWAAFSEYQSAQSVSCSFRFFFTVIATCWWFRE